MVTSIGGPPVALLYRNVKLAHARVNLSAYFLFTGATGLRALYTDALPAK